MQEEWYYTTGSNKKPLNAVALTGSPAGHPERPTHKAGLTSELNRATQKPVSREGKRQKSSEVQHLVAALHRNTLQNSLCPYSEHLLYSRTYFSNMNFRREKNKLFLH